MASVRLTAGDVLHLPSMPFIEDSISTIAAHFETMKLIRKSLHSIATRQ